jgi:Mn2+/Fe2+ NRAMP family transporter
MGRLAPLRIMSVPAFAGTWAAIGPGVIWASLAQGSGELIWWPYLTAKYGAAFLGILLPACLMQFWVNQEIVRYTATTGEPFFTGLLRLNKAFAALMWAMLVITFAWFGGYASGGATALFDLTRFPAGWSPRAGALFWAYLTIAVFLAGLVFSPVVYKLIERFMLGVVAITIVGLVVSVLNPVVLSAAGDFFTAYFSPAALFVNGMPAAWESKDADLLLTGIAFAGAGGFFNVMYSYWIRDKGHGMGKYAGRITSPITGRAESIPATGFAFEDTPENRKNYLEWLRFLRLDNAIGIGVNAFTVMLMCWLAWAILLPKGEVPEGWRLAVVQAQFFESAAGAVGRVLFLVIAAAFLSDSWLGITDACARMHADYIFNAFPRAQRWPLRTWYYIFVGILTAVSCATMLIAQPSVLLLAGGVLNFIAMAIYMPALIYLNYRVVPSAFPAWTRPMATTFWIATAISATYLVLGLVYVLFKLFGIRLIF